MENIIEPAMTPTLAQVADGTDDQENSMPNVFRGDDDDDEDAEEDAKILNMSLIKSILGNSNYGSMLDLGNSNQGNMSDAERAEKPHESRKVSFRDVGSVASSHEDEEKTHDELVKKIGELQAKLTQAEIDKSAEKAMRRKKDKSLVKLAKELNKRAADQQAKEKQVNLLKGLVADLEAKLAATRSEMDERIASSEKKTKEYNDQLDEAHQKYRNVVADHDTAVAELTKTHLQDTQGLRRSLKEAEMEIERLRTQIGTVREQIGEKAVEAESRARLHKEQLAEAQQKLKNTSLEHDKKVAEIIKKHENQIDDLRHQLLAANLECDKIRTELASHQMQASPEDAVNIINRTMRSASIRSGNAPPKKNMLGIIARFLRNSVGAIVLLMGIAFPLGLLSMDAICAPLMPGTVLATHDASSEAPWWAHDTMKADAFAICGDRPRTSLKWHGGRLVITDAGTSKILFDKRSTTASIHGSVVNLYAKNSKIETLRPPWSI